MSDVITGEGFSYSDGNDIDSPKNKNELKPNSKLSSSNAVSNDKSESFEYDKRPIIKRLLFRSLHHHKRGDIQAIRFIAVLSVVIYHIWPDILPGGYVGVDVFFVISGFLITNQIVREFSRRYHKTRRRVTVVGLYFLFRFYAARIRRLAPLSLTVLAVTMMAVHFLFTTLPSYQDATFTQIISSLLLIQNIRLEWNGHDYLHQMDEATAVNHFWSLSVEEQYYLVWPLIVVIVLCIVFGIVDYIRRKKTDHLVFADHEKKVHSASTVALAITVAIACIASFIYCQYLSTVNPTTAYFSTFARLWELGCGSLLTCIIITAKKSLSIDYNATSNISESKNKKILMQVVQIIGIIVLLISIIFFNSTSFNYPSAWTLIPVAGCFLVILAGQDNTFLRFRLFQYIGDISYSLYLWHWAIIVLVRKYFEVSPDVPPLNKTLLDFAILVASFLLSALSYKIIETPFRHHFAKKNVHVYLTACFASVCIFATVLGFTTNITHDSKMPLQNIQEITQKAIVADQKAENNSVYSASDLCYGAIAINFNKVCKNIKQPNSYQLSQIYTLPIGKNDWSMPYQYNCFHTLYPEQVGLSKIEPQKVCVFGNSNAQDYILMVGDSHAAHWSGAFDYAAKKLGLKLIVASGMKGCNYLSNAVSDECKMFSDFTKDLISNQNAKYVFFSSNKQFNYDSNDDEQNQIVKKIIDTYSLNKNIYLIEDAPNNHNIVNADNSVVGSTNCVLKGIQCTLDESYFEQKDFENKLISSSIVNESKIIKTKTRFCDKIQCYLVIGDFSVYYDEKGHISDSYSKSLGPWVLKQLKAKGIYGATN